MGLTLPSIYREREVYSATRLEDLCARVNSIRNIDRYRDLCIYITGSYGRLEASRYSDIDLFFVARGSAAIPPISRLDKIVLDAEIITTCREIGFPAPSNDGEFLQIHHLDDVIHDLGSRADDFNNFFTARLCLLLESRPVHNKTLYQEVVSELVQTYFRDYHTHTRSFRPVFIANDIIRYWKTICLNYEHRRNRPADDDSARRKNHLKNLKLKYSRLMTCYSAILVMALHSESMHPQQMEALVFTRPIERITAVASALPDAEPIANNIFEQYAWFLDVTSKPPEEVMQWISIKGQRDQAFERAREFGSSMHDLLQLACKGRDILRYIIM